uniref:NADH dehydrogenase subunit 2 n=1 Tax=Stenochironomus gibbus TaxID=1051997 RepID=UPI001FAF13F4|nr:NADH dehydrogenase subunit 2 [Stenochironomus gibbus]UKO32968.1 NADH dehydrogenase subunit 2 [Stenochironomus gibbus]
MFNNTFKLLFFFSLIFSTLISISSLSWFNSWMGLEINLLAFIVLILKSNKNSSSESSIKYFLAQTLASNILLFFIILISLFYTKLSYYFFYSMNLGIIFPLMMKIGMAPFHYWFIDITENLNWMNNLILMTWQKFAPFILISYCINIISIKIFLFMTMIAIFTGTVGGLNQTSLRKLLAFSSINHMGWMMLSIIMDMNCFKMYFFIYFILSINIMLTFNLLKIFSIKQLFNKTLSIFLKFSMNFPILSLAGLPPLTGFFPKWIIIEKLVMFNLSFLAFLICYFSLFSIFYYLRILYNLLFLNHFEMKLIFKKKNYFFSMFFMMFYFLMLILSMFSLFFMNFFFSF